MPKDFKAIQKTIERLKEAGLPDEVVENLNEWVAEEKKKEGIKEDNMPEKVVCPYCSEPLVIEAEHIYLITKSEDSGWHKEDGNVTYTCNNCDTELSVSEIKDILKQVDEL